MTKPYKRELLIKLNEKEEKKVISPEKLLEALKNKFNDEYLKFQTCDLSNLPFYYFKCESVNDQGWGCAWRSMQTALKYQLNKSKSKNEKSIKFYDLFMEYGRKEKLLEIYNKINKNQNQETKEILQKKIFAPFENNGWAEPFISQLVLYDFGFNGELFLVNGYPQGAYAPKNVFPKTISFNEFKQFLKDYYKDKNKSGPLILDDSRGSCCAIGVKFNHNEKGEDSSLELLILDPHAPNNKPGEVGLYIVVLENDGKQITVLPEPYLGSWISFNKPWMVYAPTVE